MNTPVTYVTSITLDNDPSLDVCDIRLSSGRSCCQEESANTLQVTMENNSISSDKTPNISSSIPAATSRDRWEVVKLRSEDSKVPLAARWPANYREIVNGRTEPLDAWQRYCKYGGCDVVSILKLPAYLQDMLQAPPGGVNEREKDEVNSEECLRDTPPVRSGSYGRCDSDGAVWNGRSSTDSDDVSGPDTELSEQGNISDDEDAMISDEELIGSCQESSHSGVSWNSSLPNQSELDEYGFKYVDPDHRLAQPHDRDPKRAKVHKEDPDYVNFPVADDKSIFLFPKSVPKEQISSYDYILHNPPEVGSDPPVMAADCCKQSPVTSHAPMNCSRRFSDPCIHPGGSRLQDYVSSSGYRWQIPLYWQRSYSLTCENSEQEHMFKARDVMTCDPDSNSQVIRSPDAESRSEKLLSCDQDYGSHNSVIQSADVLSECDQRPKHMSSYKESQSPFEPIPEEDETDDMDDRPGIASRDMTDDTDDTDLANVTEGDDDVFTDDTSQVTVENGQKLQVVMDAVAMDQKLTSYRVHLAATNALLDLDTDVASLHGNHVIVTNNDDEENFEDPGYALVVTLLRREHLYQECLRSIFDLYAEPLRKFSSLTLDDHRVLFLCLEPILSFSTALCLKLNDAIQTWDPGTTRIGNLFSKQFWHHYEEYYLNYGNVRQLLRHKRETDEEFTEFCRMRHGTARHSIDSLLLLPVQRVPDYDVFLQRRLAEMDQTHPDYDDVKKSAEKVHTMVKEREEELQHAESEQRMEKIQERFPKDDLQLHEEDKKNKNMPKRRSTAGAVLLKSLVKKHHHPGDKNPASQGPTSTHISNVTDCVNNPILTNCLANRILVLEGPVQLTAACQTLDRYLFLFNDLLLVAKQKSSNVFKLKQRVRVSEIWVTDCIDDVAESYRPHDRSIVIGWPTTNFVATFSSPQLLNVWREKLIRHIAEQKEKEEGCCIARIRYFVDHSSYYTYKTLSVTNTEDAYSLLNRCFEEFHILGHDPKDYQLWSVSPNKEESPYPLFGHENPYSIRKNHEREWGQENGENVIDSFHELNLSYFNLKSAKKKPRDLSVDDPKRVKKIKRSPLHGIFKKSQKATPVPPSGCLFGHNLSEICEDDKLPEAIMVVLRVLFLNGPFTIGVFRKPGSHKKCQDVKSKLDSGEPITTDDITVPVAASLLKEFLLNLPNCLLGSELFDQWVATTYLAGESQKVKRINMTKGYIESLSVSHQSLLRHLICVLYTIVRVQRDKDQGMDSYNMSVCISQSMLFPSLSNSSSMSEIVSKVPNVVQFLLENCMEIFGEECVKIFGALPEQSKSRQDSSTDSDSVHSMLSSLPEQQYVNTRDNSSLDSLERDCYGGYGEIDCSPQLAKSHLSPTNLSRDSGLTLSDTQLYEDGTESEHSSIQPRKSSVVRSFSQFDEPPPDADPGPLSSSHDGFMTIGSSGLPVPPPRKPKRRSAGNEMEIHPKGQVILRNSASANTLNDHRKHFRNISSRRISDDSTLGSLDEEELVGLNVEQYRGEADMGILRKSESGAHLYLNDINIMQQSNTQRSLHKEHRKSAQLPDQSVPTGLHHQHRDANKPVGTMEVQSMPNLTIPEHQVLSLNNRRCDPSPVFCLAPPDETQSGSNSFMDNVVFDQVVPRLKEDAPPPRPPEPQNYRHHQSKQAYTNPQNKAHRLQKAFSEDSEHQSHGASQGRVKTLTSGGSVDRGRSRLTRSNAIDSTIIRRGMTPSGEDKFPAKMKLHTSLYSLDEDSLMQAKVMSNKLNSSTSQSSSGSHGTNGAGCQRSDSYSGVAPSLASQMRQRTMEKSASDMAVCEQFELSGPVLARGKSRPTNPPSYEEAIHRQSQLRDSPREFNLTEQDIVIQQKNSAKAKKLYEESLKRYQTQDLSSSLHNDGQHWNNGLKNNDQSSTQNPMQHPPPYRQACKQAVQIREQQSQGQKVYSHQTHNQAVNNQSIKGPYGKLVQNHSRQSSNSSDRHSSSPSKAKESSLHHQHIRDLPAEVTDSHAQYQTAPVLPTESSARRTDSPVRRTDSPARRTDSPARRTDSSARRTDSSTRRTDSPKRIDSPARRTDSPASRTDSPKRIDSPARRTDSSVRRTNSPVQHSDSPRQENKHQDSLAKMLHQRNEGIAQKSNTSDRRDLSNRSSTESGNHHRQISARDQQYIQPSRAQAEAQTRHEARWEYEPTQDNVPQPAVVRDKPSSRSSSHSSRESTPNRTREGTPTQADKIPRVGSDRSRHQQHRERRWSGSRSRERRVGQRYSDPKMTTAKAALITNISRSKSDSQEHLDKVNKFKTFQAYDNNKENISLEDLRVEDLRRGHRSNRSTPERNPSDERIKLRYDNSNRRHSGPIQILKSAADILSNEKEHKETLRPHRHSIHSLKNKDWHKELALQYSDMFYQPKEIVDTPNKVIKFGYVNQFKEYIPATVEKSKQRWTPPVHPTKDLVYVTKDEKHMSRSSNRSVSGVVMRNGSTRVVSDNKSRSQERPTSLMSDDMQKLKEEYSRSRSESRAQNNKNSANLDMNTQSSKARNDEQILNNDLHRGSVNWSVAQLRMKYIPEDKLHKQKCNQNTKSINDTNPHFYHPGSQPPAPSTQHRSGRNIAPWHSKTHKTHTRPVLEHTNPNADEAYV